MALVKCRECGHEVSNKAKACPNCGAKPKGASDFLKYVAGFIVLLFVLFAIGKLSGQQPSQPESSPISSATPQQVQPPQPTESPVNFDLPLQTTRGTLVCPLSAALDNREGHGLQAAMKSRVEIFGRQEDAEKAGCHEWREGLPIQLSDEEKQQAKKWQADHICGMLTFDGGFIFSCDLRNTSDNKIDSQNVRPTNNSGTARLKWDAPASLSGTLESGVFENCCINGEASKQKYFFLRLDSKIDIERGGGDGAAMDGVDAIQLGGALPGVNEGQRIVVACKQIWQGNTGHYALPVYCNEPKAQ